MKAKKALTKKAPLNNHERDHQTGEERSKADNLQEGRLAPINGNPSGEENTGKKTSRGQGRQARSQSRKARAIPRECSDGAQEAQHLGRLDEHLIISPYNAYLMTEAKTINLTIGERLAALKLFDAFKGSITTLAGIMDDVKQFPVTAEEWTEANLVKTPNQDGTENWKWDEKVNKDVTLAAVTVQYLLEEINKKSDAGEVTLADMALLSLNEKLK